MTDASTSFELVEFEQVQAGPRTVLLRLATRPSEAFTLAGLALVLDGDGDGDAVRLTPLPGPPGAADLLRAAFAAAPELLAGSTTYSLELADGSLVALPAPTQRSATRHPTPAAAPPEHPDAPRLAEAEQRAASRRLAIVELQRRLSAEHSRRSAAEAEARTARAAATAEAAAHVELRTRLADAEADSERLRTALDEATHSAAAEAQAAAALSTQVAELEAAAASAEELRAQLTELECRLEDEQAQLEAAESDVRAGREQFAGVEAELAGVRAAAEEVAAALADRTTEVELLREAAVARERELEEQLVAQRRKFEAELADRPGPAQAPEPLAHQPDAFDSVADALLAGAAEVELLRIATS